MKYIVYQTTNLKNNKIYIGVHKCENPEVFDGYIGCGIKITVPSSYMNPVTPLQYAVKKYGTSAFRRTLLNVCDTVEEAFTLEKQIVNQSFINRGDTYNAKLGGLGGSSYYMVVNQFDLSGKFLKKWNSIIDISDFLDLSDTAISHAIKCKTSKRGFYWAQSEEINIKEYTLEMSGQKCYQYSENGKFITFYDSLLEAARDNEVSLQSVQRAVKGGYLVNKLYYSTELVDTYVGKPKVSLKNKVIYIYSLDGEFITSLKNGKEICEFFNIKSTSSITTAIRTGRQYRNYQISLEYKEKLDKVVDKRNIRKKVAQYTLTGELVTTFESITQACNEFGTGVQKVLRGQQKQCKNFIFKYIS